MFQMLKQNRKNLPLHSDVTGDEVHYLTDYQNAEMSRMRNALIDPFYKMWKDIHKLS